MTDRPPHHDPAPDSVFEQAAVWHARMRETEFEEDAEPALRQTLFESWLAEDDRHRRAYEEVGRLWSALETPVAQSFAAAGSPTPIGVPRRRARRPVLARLALAACVLLAAFAGWVWHEPLLDDLRSDHVTAVGELRTVDLADGSRVVLDSDSALSVDFVPGERRVRLFRGQAWFEVGRDPDRPFVVDTDSGSVRVLGTRFDVRIRDHAAVVSLVEGKVELRGGGQIAAGPVALRPGQQARLTEDGVSAPRPFRPATVEAWRQGRLVFYDTPLSEAVEELNRYRPGRIVIVSPGLANLRVSGVFRVDRPDAAITAIEEALPVRVDRLTDYLVLLR